MERIIILLACEKCKRRNYSTMRSGKEAKEKLKIKKYCPFCKGHILHKETKA
ncbi:MAG: 50S ribosomal protein L33 [Deltaproteobacteria bacterium]